MGGLSLVNSIAVGAAYFFLFRPMRAAVDLAAVERLLRDPSIPIEAIRRVALQGHETVAAGFVAVESAVVFLFVFSAVAGAALLYVFFGLRGMKQEADGGGA
jgi:hypothetical protein